MLGIVDYFLISWLLVGGVIGLFLVLRGDDE